MTEQTTGTTTHDFGELYEQHLGGVYRFVHYRVGERDLAEDLTSDIFQKALAGFNGFDPAKASFSTWIYSIARNAVIDHYRKRSREMKLREETEQDVPSGALSPDDKLAESEDKRKLHECLLKLKTHEQEIVSLKFSSGMTNREIAGITGYSETNVGTILCRAVRKLRDEFSGW